MNDSGMPEEAYWNSLLDIGRIIQWLDITPASFPVAEIGCGYGTFTVPIAQASGAQVYAFDIEPTMLETAKGNALRAGLQNIHFLLRDVLEEGTGLQARSVGMVLLFNILHFGERRILLEEASRILRPSGTVAIIHWRKDIATPRGPDIGLRPDQATILDSVSGLDLHDKGKSGILEPYHWGIQLVKGARN